MPETNYRLNFLSQRSGPRWGLTHVLARYLNDLLHVDYLYPPTQAGTDHFAGGPPGIDDPFDRRCQARSGRGICLCLGKLGIPLIKLLPPRKLLTSRPTEGQWLDKGGHFG